MNNICRGHNRTLHGECPVCLTIREREVYREVLSNIAKQITEAEFENEESDWDPIAASEAYSTVILLARKALRLE